MCVCTWGGEGGRRGMPMTSCGGQGSMLDVLFYHSPPIVTKGLSLNLELVEMARLACQQAPGLPYSSPQH